MHVYTCTGEQREHRWCSDGGKREIKKAIYTFVYIFE
jgi:hypothetical protein